MTQKEHFMWFHKSIYNICIILWFKKVYLSFIVVLPMQVFLKVCRCFMDTIMIMKNYEIMIMKTSYWEVRNHIYMDDLRISHQQWKSMCQTCMTTLMKPYPNLLTAKQTDYLFSIVLQWSLTGNRECKTKNQLPINHWLNKGLL